MYQQLCVWSLSLSLSRVLSRVPSMARSWCIVSFAIIVRSYDVIPLYSLVMNWVFLLKLSYRIESLMIWEHLMYVLPWLSVVTMGYHVPLDVCFGDQLAGSAHEPMHRGWHTFSSWLSGRNFGALFEVLCVGWIDGSEIVWCISYNHAHRYLRWQWSI